MEITEVRIKLTEDNSERLQGFCSITIDHCFVVRDLKIIEGANGPFVAMPSRKLTAHCPKCNCKNHLRASYCNQCGHRLRDDRAAKDEDSRARLYADIAHPINAACREMIQEKVIQAFREELEQAKLPGYVSRYDDPDEEYAPPPPPHVRRGSKSKEQRRAERPTPHVKPRTSASSVACECTSGGRVSADVPSAAPAAAPLAESAPGAHAPLPSGLSRAESQARLAGEHRPVEGPPGNTNAPQEGEPRHTKRDNFGAGIW